MWARRAIRFIHKNRNRCCDAAAKFFFTISLVCCCRKHTALTLKKRKNTTTESKIAAYFRWNVIGPMVPDSLGRVDTCDVFKEKKKNKTSPTLKERKEKLLEKVFFISHFWTEKKFWRSVVNLCFDTFFLFYYFPLFSLTKEKEWLQQWKWQANGRHRERPQEHTWSRVIPRRPISQAKLLCVSGWMKMSRFPQS